MSKTKMETFLFVKEHLLKQNAKSVMEDGKCAYRGKNGLSCAVGCLIPNELYTPDIEMCSISMTHRCTCPLCQVTKSKTEKLQKILHQTDWCIDIGLLSELQNLHDHNRPEFWPGMLEDIEKRLLNEEMARSRQETPLDQS